MKENYEQKEKRILTKMALSELTDSVKDLKSFLEHPEMVGQVNLNEVKMLSKKIKDAETPAKVGQWLFKFRGWWFVENKSFVKLDENGVPDKLKRYPAMPTTIFIMPGSPHDLPPILTGRKNVEFVEDSNEQSISTTIFTKTGATIPVSEFGGLTL